MQSGLFCFAYVQEEVQKIRQSLPDILVRRKKVAGYGNVPVSSSPVSVIRLPIGFELNTD